MNQDPINRAEYDQSGSNLLRGALILEIASLVGNLVGKTLHIPSLVAVSKLGEVVGVGLGYGAIIHQLEVEDNLAQPK